MTGVIPFTPPAKEILEAAMEECLALGHDHIGTAHLFLGILKAGDPVTAGALEGLGLSIEDLRKEALEVLAEEPVLVVRPPRIQAKAIELADAEGRVRALLDLRPDGSPYLEMRDAAGRVRLVIGLDASGAPSVRFRDEEGKPLGTSPEAPPPAAPGPAGKPPP
jgi:hypothetical protein